MSKFGLLSEEDAEEFVTKVHFGHKLIKDYSSLNNDSSVESQLKRKQIEIELNDLDNWFDGKRTKL